MSLRLVKEHKIDTSSGLNGFNLTDIYTSEFDAYKMTFSNCQSGGAAASMEFRFITSDGMIHYDSNYAYARRGSFTDQAYGYSRADNAARIASNGPVFYTQDFLSAGCILYVFNPTNKDSWTNCMSTVAYRDSDSGGHYKAVGSLKSKSFVTGFNGYLTNTSATIKKMTLRIYGIGG